MLKRIAISLLVVAFSLWIAFMAILMYMMNSGPNARPASDWQSESWMQKDETLPEKMPSRILAMTDLPPLEPAPTPKDIMAAVAKSKDAGCNAAVLTFSWPSLESSPGKYSFDELKSSVELNSGRFLFLGIQVVNTTVKELPADLQGKPFDDPDVIQRFGELLDALGPLLRNRIRFLSIGNETDVYLGANPAELTAFTTFLNKSRQQAKSISENIQVGTTLTDGGALRADCQELVQSMDAHFLTYYHGQHGLEGSFKDAASTSDDLIALAAALDTRPIVFQEIGYPAHPSIGSEQQQAMFVNGVFDAWDQLGDRVPMINYFMMYDFPREFVESQVAYYGVSDETEQLANFIGSLGLHQTDGTPRSGWEIFQQRGKRLQ